MKWPALTALIFIVIVLAWLGADGESGHHHHGAGSCLDHDEAGLSLARAYLDGDGRHPTALLARPFAQAALPDQGVLLCMQPGHDAGWSTRRHADDADEDDGDAPSSSPPASKDAPSNVPSAPRPMLEPAIERWLERGGRLVVGLDRGWRDFAVQDGDGAVVQTLPLLAGVRTLEPPVARTLAPHAAAQGGVTVWARGDQPLIVRHAVGAGELWVLACPEVLSNAQLASADHLALLLALVGDGRPVWFDEHAHGLDAGLGVVELLRRKALGPALLITAVLTAVWFWRRRVRLGAAADPWRDQRAEAIEGVDALAGLYQRALSRRDTLDLYRQRLLREVILRTGQSPLAARATVERLTGGLRLPPREPAGGEFAILMHRLNHAFRSFRDEHHSRRP